MQLTKIELKNFRCFSNVSLEFNHRLVLIEGDNGVGKTSILEALHYLCYLRSFRTHSPRDLLKFGQENFFIKVSCSQQDESFCEIQVGFSGKKKLVKVNQKAVSSYKELMDYYRIITLTEDDLFLINGSPDRRRAYLDQAILLQDPTFLVPLREVRQVADHRNMLLSRGSVSQDSYALWSEQLWAKSMVVQTARRELLAQLAAHVQELMSLLGLSYTIAFKYQLRGIKEHASWQDFFAASPGLYADEMRIRHSMFGAHLDDIAIELQDKKSKMYASRGQQKLIVVLLKIAQLQRLVSDGIRPVFLLDDFMTDFDEKVIEALMNFLVNLDTQLLFTVPARGPIEHILDRYGAQRVKMSRLNDSL